MKDSCLGKHQVEDGREAHRRAREPGAPTRIGVEALFRAHAPFVAAFLGRLGIPPSDVDDLVQEVFLVAHRKGGYESGPAKPRSWLGAIAVRVASSRRRSAHRRKEVAVDDEQLEAVVFPGATPAERYQAREALGRVQQALQSLDLEHRGVFVLYELEGESCQAIAASFGIPVGTVYSRLHHARRRFTASHRALLAADGVDAPLGPPLPAGEGR